MILAAGLAARGDVSSEEEAVDGRSRAARAAGKASRGKGKGRGGRGRPKSSGAKKAASKRGVVVTSNAPKRARRDA